MTSEEAAAVNLDDMTQCSIGGIGEIHDEDAGSDGDGVAVMLKVHRISDAASAVAVLTMAEAASVASQIAAAVARNLERWED